MTYGNNEAKKIFCKKHEQFHPHDETCPWCPPPAKKEVIGGSIRSFESLLTEEQKKLAEEHIRLLMGV